MEAQKCGRCAAPAESSCGRCGRVPYCSRKCQLDDWPSHKKTCLDSGGMTVVQARHRKFIEHANKRLIGNIMILAAHSARPAEGQTIHFHAQIDETIEEFTSGSSFHFAHLSAAVAPGTEPQVVYTLKGYTQTLPIELIHLDALDQIRHKYPAQTSPWSIFFEM
jgi:hypothetical protein